LTSSKTKALGEGKRNQTTASISNQFSLRSQKQTTSLQNHHIRIIKLLLNGPIQNFHRRESFADYLDSNFDGKHDLMQFVSVMLSTQSSAIFLTRLMQLARDISDQHRLDLS
jgi:hypothetical protein